MASKKAKAAKARRDRRGGNGASLRPAADRGRGPARQPARLLRRGDATPTTAPPARSGPPTCSRTRSCRRTCATASENLRAATDALREPEKKDSSTLRPAAPDRVRRRDPGARPERGPAQGRCSTSCSAPRRSSSTARRPPRRPRRRAPPPPEHARPQPNRRPGASSAASARAASSTRCARASPRAGSPARRSSGSPREAGVSRGLLHYYFGTKERLLVEVVRRDSEIRVSRLDAPLAAAAVCRRRPRRPRLQPPRPDRERARLLRPPLRALHRRAAATPRCGARWPSCSARREPRSPTALESKDAEGVISLRFGAEATVSYLFAIADGYAVQALSDPDRDHAAVLEAGREAARHLLVAD